MLWDCVISAVSVVQTRPWKYRARCSAGDSYSSPWFVPALWTKVNYRDSFSQGGGTGTDAIVSSFSLLWVFWSNVSFPQNHMPEVLLKIWAAQQLLWPVHSCSGCQELSHSGAHNKLMKIAVLNHAGWLKFLFLFPSLSWRSEDSSPQKWCLRNCSPD